MTINHSMHNQGLVKLVTPHGAAPDWQPLEITPDAAAARIWLDLFYLTTYCPMAAWVGLWYEGPFTIPYAGLEEWRWEWPNEFSGNLLANTLVVAEDADPATDPRQPRNVVTVTNGLEIYGFYNRTEVTKRTIVNVAANCVAVPWIALWAPGGTCRIDQHTTYNDGVINHLRIPCFIPEVEYTAAMLAADNITTGTWVGGPDLVTLEIIGLYAVIEEQV